MCSFSLSGRYAVARFVNRKGSIPYFAALVAQREEVDLKDGSQKQPPGMHAIFLPYADDIRHPKFEPTPIGRHRLHLVLVVFSHVDSFP